MFFLFWFLFSVAVGILASNRGRSGFGWFLLSIVISPLVAGIFVAVSKNLATASGASSPSEETHIKCPACAELVLPEANKCKHCGTDLVPDHTYRQRRENLQIQKNKEDGQNILIGVGMLAAVIVVAWLIAR